MEKRSFPQLLRAKTRIHDGSRMKYPGDKLVTGLSFDTLHNEIGSSFFGNRKEGVNGEPFCMWMMKKFVNGVIVDEKVQSDILKFFLSFPIHETMRSKEKFLDVSIQTPEGVIASTALIVDYKKRSRLGSWWKHVCSKVDELCLTFNMWRKGTVPEFVTSPVWKVQRNAAITGIGNAVDVFDNIHTTKGPQYRHWYIKFVATNVNLQGRGYGSQIMKKVSNLADQEKADCYLECCSRKNKAFYEKFGFKEIGSHTLEKQNDDSTIYAMVRHHT